MRVSDIQQDGINTSVCRSRLASVVAERFLAASRLAPGAPALEDPFASVSRGCHAQRITLISETLGALSSPGSLVAVYCERDRNLVSSILAVLAAGSADVPLEVR